MSQNGPRSSTTPPPPPKRLKSNNEDTKAERQLSASLLEFIQQIKNMSDVYAAFADIAIQLDPSRSSDSPLTQEEYEHLFEFNTFWNASVAMLLKPLNEVENKLHVNLANAVSYFANQMNTGLPTYMRTISTSVDLQEKFRKLDKAKRKHIEKIANEKVISRNRTSRKITFEKENESIAIEPLQHFLRIPLTLKEICKHASECGEQCSVAHTLLEDMLVELEKITKQKNESKIEDPSPEIREKENSFLTWAPFVNKKEAPSLEVFLTFISTLQPKEACSQIETSVIHLMQREIAKVGALADRKQPKQALELLLHGFLENLLDYASLLNANQPKYEPLNTTPRAPTSMESTLANQLFDQIKLLSQDLIQGKYKELGIKIKEKADDAKKGLENQIKSSLRTPVS